MSPAPFIICGTRWCGGAMMCNVWNKVDDARELILRGTKETADMLVGAIR